MYGAHVLACGYVRLCVCVRAQAWVGAWALHICVARSYMKFSFYKKVVINRAFFLFFPCNHIINIYPYLR
jgi:hypothetical protein